MINVFIMILVTGCALSLVAWPLRTQRWIGVGLLGALIVVGAGYAYWGAWSAQQRFIRQQEHEQAATAMLRKIKNPSELMSQLQQHLSKHPHSARGWYLLGRLYASQHHWEEAHAAFRKAYHLQPDHAQIAVNYAQSLLTRRQNGDVNLAKHILKNILEKQPHHMDALLLLAVEAQERHAVDEALSYWRRLLILVPDDSPEAESIRKAIHDLK